MDSLPFPGKGFLAKEKKHSACQLASLVIWNLTARGRDEQYYYVNNL
jgi:hypothetical protein